MDLRQREPVKNHHVFQPISQLSFVGRTTGFSVRFCRRSPRRSLGELAPPELLGLAQRLQDLRTLLRVVQLERSDALADPIREELRRLALHRLRLAADLHIPRTGGGKAERVRHVRDRAHQKPTALVQLDGLRQRNTFHAAVANQFHGRDRITRIKLGLKLDLHRAVALEDMTGPHWPLARQRSSGPLETNTCPARNPSHHFGYVSSPATSNATNSTGIAAARPAWQSSSHAHTAPKTFNRMAGQNMVGVVDLPRETQPFAASRPARPAAARLASCISEYLRERISPSAPAFSAAVTAA